MTESAQQRHESVKATTEVTGSVTSVPTPARNQGSPSTAENPSNPRSTMLKARYGEPTDTYTWERVVDRCLDVLRRDGFVIMKADSRIVRGAPGKGGRTDD